jgi:plasmid maintenance system antidote protein VapI
MDNEKVLEKFKLAIFVSGLKKIDIAAKMGITNGHLVNMLNGRDKLSEEKRKSLNKILKSNY